MRVKQKVYTIAALAICILLLAGCSGEPKVIPVISDAQPTYTLENPKPERVVSLDFRFEPGYRGPTMPTIRAAASVENLRVSISRTALTPPDDWSTSIIMPGRRAGNTRFWRLRAVAYALNHTQSQFDVLEHSDGRVELLPGKPYTPIGGELTPVEWQPPPPDDELELFDLPGNFAVLVEGKPDVMYLIADGWMYVMLEELAMVIDIEATFSTICTNEPYIASHIPRIAEDFLLEY